MSYGKVRKMWENDEGTKGNQRQITIYTKVILPEVVWKKTCKFISGLYKSHWNQEHTPVR